MAQAGRLPQPLTRHRPLPARGSGCTEAQLLQATSHAEPGKKRTYACQATRLLAASKPLPWWNIGQYAEDYMSGNASLTRLGQAATYVAYVQLSFAYRRTIGIPGRWLYDRFQWLRGGIPFPRRKGMLPLGQATARQDLDLQPGEMIRVKSYEDILATLDTSGANRHLQFDAEMVPYCGGVYRVRSRIELFVDEKTGEMRNMKTPAIILEGVVCQACYSHHRMLCPRGIYSWWREIWLERVADKPAPDRE